MITCINNEIIIENNISLTDKSTKRNIINSTYNWEEWIKNFNNETVSYRLLLDKPKNKYGRLFLIVTFTVPINEKSLLCSWHLAPEKLINGKQNNPKGKVTNNLKKWFYEETGTKLPIRRENMHIDASYDPWNYSGVIVCNYRSNFENEKAWKDYCKRNHI
ncbi:hypothetical protein [Xenorhabdus bharatensis]|uniref:hypothetical protein n=1 Tax=Xenorhabdus bharatensis TaxID=3136256 RepID=UPI0030F466BF